MSLGQHWPFHLTHIDNLEGALVDGTRRADAVPTIDLPFDTGTSSWEMATLSSR